MFTMLVNRTGAVVAATDTIASRLDLAKRCGAGSRNPATPDVAAEVKALTEDAAPTS
jgi:threonine dehydrogenase-like Zn-dependent dehydrogenase